MMRHVSCILLLEWSTTSQRLWVYRIPVPYAQKVPQGSFLGPLAFLLYINDLVDNISQCKTLLYADDTILLSSHQDVDIATTQLQNDLTKLDTCFDNKLSINYKKTKTMIFGPSHLTEKTTIDPFYMKQHRLKMVGHYKYLGITLDRHLTFNLHLSNVIQQGTEKGYLLPKIRPYLDKESSLSIYKTMILPYAEYGDFF